MNKVPVELSALVELDKTRRDGKPEKEWPAGPVPHPFPGWDDREKWPNVSANVWAWYPGSEGEAKPPEAKAAQARMSGLGQQQAQAKQGEH